MSKQDPIEKSDGSRAREKRARAERRRQGYLLLPVMLMLSVVAASVYILAIEGVSGSHRANAEAEADIAEYVAQAGLEVAGWHAVHAGCRGDFTVPSGVIGAHGFKLSGAAGGETSIVTAASDQSAWVRSDDVTTNNSGADVHIRNEAAGQEYGLFRFDLSGVAVGSRINSAVARFWVESNGEFPEGPIELHRVESGWSEGTVTYGSLGGAFASGTLASIWPQATGGSWVEVNLTAQVQSWVNGTPNFGVLLSSPSDGVHAKLAGRSAGSTAPELEIVVGTEASSPAQITSTGRLASGTMRVLQRPVFEMSQPESRGFFSLGSDRMDDTSLDSEKPDTNSGTRNKMSVESGVERAMIRFELEGLIPAGARVLEATLELTPTDVKTPGSIDAYGATRTWIEGTCDSSDCADGATWNSWDGQSGADAEPVTIDVAPMASQLVSSDETTELDLTGIVSEWVRGHRPNMGIQLRGSGAVADFATSDHSNTVFHPRLRFRYACECGVACLAGQGVGSLLFVVSDALNLTATEESKRRLFLGWGYGVTPISAVSSSSTFDSLLATTDVVYISAGIVASDLAGIRLAEFQAGVVSEHIDLIDDLGLASSGSAVVGTTVDIVDASHEITGPFVAGPLELFDRAMTGGVYSGSIAASADELVTWGGSGALVVLEAGELMTTGVTAPRRRVHVPISGAAGLAVEHLTSDGRLLLQRAVEWAANGASPETGGPGFWIATVKDVEHSDAPSLDEWTSSQVVSLGGTALTLEPGTSHADLAIEFDLDRFASGAEVDAIHIVSRSLIVGTANAVALLEGDLLLSSRSDETLTSENTLSVAAEDVFVFRPTTEGDYSNGAFLALLDGSLVHGENDTVGITLAEANTIVGDVVVRRGDFLFATSAGTGVLWFSTVDVGEMTTSGTATVLLSSSDLGIDPDISGVELVEEDLTLGGLAIESGSVLLAVDDDDDGVGDNVLPVDGSDVFALEVESTGVLTKAQATLVFEGADINLEKDEEHVAGLSLAGLSPAEGDAFGPVAHWRFDETTGGFAEDSAGGHHGSLSGPSWTGGQVAGGLDFDGSGDLVTVPHDDTLNLTDALTFTAWIRMASEPSGYQVILSKDLPGTGWEYYFGTYGTELVLSFYSSGNYREVFADGEFNASQWYHVAATFNGESDLVRFFVGGAEIAAENMEYAPQSGTGVLEIGASDLGEYWDGVLDEVRIYDRVLATAEIVALGEAGSPPDATSGAGDGTCTVADDFESDDYEGSSGDLPWLGPWEEVGESNGPGRGDEQVRSWGDSFAARIRDNDNGGEGLERSVDLSAGFTSVRLEFQYWRLRLDNPSDYVALSVSTDGGNEYFELGRLEGPGDDDESSPQAVAYDLGDYVSAETRIRLLTSAENSGEEGVYLDDVIIRLEGDGCP